MNDTRTPNTKRAVIYLRVSTAKQAVRDNDPDGYSVPAQREAGLRKAAQLEAEVIEAFVERGEPPNPSDRPVFQRLLALIRARGNIHSLIVEKVARFPRNRRDDANLLFELQSFGCQLISVKENIDDTPA